MNEYEIIFVYKILVVISAVQIADTFVCACAELSFTTVVCLSCGRVSFMFYYFLESSFVVWVNQVCALTVYLA